MTTRIYCDFDGTITTTENMVSLINSFVPTDVQSLKSKIYTREISIREGVSTMFESIPVSAYDAMIAHVKSEAIFRSGFSELLALAAARGYEFYVVSGGFTFFIEPLLKDYTGIQRVYANELVIDGDRLRVSWPVPCDVSCANDCGLCKVKVLEQLHQPGDVSIVIGDSITDFQISKRADLVFARDFLVKCCRNEDIPFHEFRTFHDVIAVLETEGVVTHANVL
ncbi:MAG: MtnX-like HAD-IB family phosphatase [Bacilli bacterium]